jgi:TonB family protein
MFDRLIASRSRPDVGRGSAASLVSLSLHAGLVAGAVFASVAAEESPPVIVPPGPVIYIDPNQRPEPPAPGVLVADPSGGFPPVVPPRVIPSGLPPIDLGPAFDPQQYARGAPIGDGGTGAAPGPAGFYVPMVVEEAPELLTGPPLAYPELVRRAGFQGRVEIEAIIDSTGRAEPGSIVAVRSPHPAFEAPARDFVRQALFRPGRIRGRAVRVLVRLPIDFTLR